LLAKEYNDHGHMNNPNLPRGRDTHRIYCFNYRMTETQAVIAKVQLSKLNYIVKKLEKFKEEGSTTKWFSEEFLLTSQIEKLNLNSS